MDSYRTNPFNPSAILISGYAKLPAHITSEEIYKVLVVAAIVDSRTGVIIEAEVSLITDLTKNFISSIMCGYDLNLGPDLLISRFEACYFGSAKKAIETAIRMIFSKYDDIKNGKILPETDYR